MSNNSYKPLHDNANIMAVGGLPGSHKCCSSASLSFVENDFFQRCMGVVILTNLFVLAGETDYPHWPVWGFLDNTILFVFCTEAGLKLCYLGCFDFFSGVDRVWNSLDLFIVLLGFLEIGFGIFLHPDTSKKTANGGNSLVSVIQVLRLLRLLRLFKLIRVVKPLMGLVQAFSAMTESFTVVLGVLVMWILACGIMCTQLLGRLPRQDADDEASKHIEALRPELTKYFGDVPTSMFSLFQVTTLDNWINIAKPALALDSRWQVFFVVFICMASWTIISILTAVASENVVESAMGREEAQKRAESDAQKAFLSFLRDAFQAADVDGNGLLDKEEFEGLINQEEVIERMRASSSLSISDLIQAWDALDVNRTGELTIDEFVTGLSMMNEGLSTKHVANFDYALQRSTYEMLGRIVRLAESVSEMRERNQEVLELLRGETTRSQQTASQLWAWRCAELAKAQSAKDQEMIRQLEALKEPRIPRLSITASRGARRHRRTSKR